MRGLLPCLGEIDTILGKINHLWGGGGAVSGAGRRDYGGRGEVWRGEREEEMEGRG